MLARRFAVVCLLALMFGLFFADLVARSASARSFAAPSWQTGCSWLDTRACSRRPLRF